MSHRIDGPRSTETESTNGSTSAPPARLLNTRLDQPANAQPSVAAFAGLAQAAAPPRSVKLQAPAARAWGERLFELPLIAAAMVSILTTAGIVGILVFETVEFF